MWVAARVSRALRMAKGGSGEKVARETFKCMSQLLLCRLRRFVCLCSDRHCCKRQLPYTVQEVPALIGCGDTRDAGLPKLVGIDGRSNLVGASQLRGTTQHTTSSIHGMQHPTMQHVVCNFQRAVCTDAHACRMQHTTDNVQQPTCRRACAAHNVAGGI